MVSLESTSAGFSTSNSCFTGGSYITIVIPPRLWYTKWRRGFLLCALLGAPTGSPLWLVMSPFCVCELSHLSHDITFFGGHDISQFLSDHPLGRPKNGDFAMEVIWSQQPIEILSGKFTQTLVVVGVGRLVSIKNGWFSGSMFIYQRVDDTMLTVVRIHDLPFFWKKMWLSATEGHITIAIPGWGSCEKHQNGGEPILGLRNNNSNEI